MGVGKNIKLLIDERNIKQKELYETIEESQVNVSRWLNESRAIPSDVLLKIANFLNVSIDLLMDNPIKNTLSNVKFIPLIGLAHCGEPQEYDLNGYEPIPIGENQYKQKMYAVKTEGDSMIPKINDGDIAYCIFDEHIESGDIVHYSLNGESGIRRYKINEAQTIISLVPLNSEYEIITIHHDEYFELKMAKVVGLHRVF